MFRNFSNASPARSPVWLTGLVCCALLFLGACASKGSAPVYTRESGAERKTAAAQPVLTRQARNPSRIRTSRTYYLVQPGDTLYSIAWRHYLEHKQLAAWNGIKGPDYAIYPGQRLRLKPHERRVKDHPAGAPSATRRQPPVVATIPTAPHKPAVRQTTPKPPPERKSLQPAPVKPTPVTAQKKNVKLAWAWPTKGKVIRTFSSQDHNRKGVWISGRDGQPVKAAEAGRVVYAGDGLVGYGNLVIIKHDRDYLSAYGYNRKLLVKEGDKLTKGDIVAYMGSPNSDARPVLHFEIRKKGKPINPLPLLPRR
ncbi:MAG: peptidoglycan DD-metalloendopeptidase family protein [Candidatus Thiodiazotropha sp.]